MERQAEHLPCSLQHSVPILLASLLFTRETERAWVSDHTLEFLFAVLVLDLAIGLVFLTPYYPPVLSYPLVMP